MRHEDIWGSGGITPPFLTSARSDRFTPRGNRPCTHSKWGCWLRGCNWKNNIQRIKIKCVVKIICVQTEVASLSGSDAIIASSLGSNWILSGVQSAGWLDIHFTVGTSCERAAPLAEENAAARHHVLRSLISLHNEHRVFSTYDGYQNHQSGDPAQHTDLRLPKAPYLRYNVPSKMF
jgi:hypothetical protein